MSEMKGEFIACLSSMTYKNYLQQSKQLIAWFSITKKISNPKILNVDMNKNNPLTNEIRRRILWLPEEDDDEQYHLCIHSFKYDNFQIIYLKDVSNFDEIYWLNFCFC